MWLRESGIELVRQGFPIVGAIMGAAYGSERMAHRGSKLTWPKLALWSLGGWAAGHILRTLIVSLIERSTPEIPSEPVVLKGKVYRPEPVPSPVYDAGLGYNHAQINDVQGVMYKDRTVPSGGGGPAPGAGQVDVVAEQVGAIQAPPRKPKADPGAVKVPGHFTIGAYGST